MLKIRARNSSSRPTTAHIWLATNLDGKAALEKGELLAQDGQLVRAVIFRIPPTSP